MDDKTKAILKTIKSHSRIKQYLTVLCYILIVGGILFYIIDAINKTNHTIKLVNDYKNKPKEFKATKTMINPSIDYQYNENEVYHIQAAKAYHESDQEVIMYDISAKGKIGNIEAGKLEIKEKGERLIFTDNPVLILNETNK